ncbi:MAG: serine hydrolase domain-containing protein [Actinomycetes bacterium]
MGDLTVDVEPEQVGFDSSRLQQIDRHFKRFVEDGRLPGWLIAVSRAGELAHVSTYGLRDIENNLPVETDSLFRIYSMTKPVTSVAAMMLYEQGAFHLKDPISKFIPAFADQKVYVQGPATSPVTKPAIEPIRIWHLLTHMAGLTYGFHYAHPTDAIYRHAGFDFGGSELNLAESCDRWATLPLMFEPGSEWNYSVATDVLGRIVEVASGTSLDEFFTERIFEPLRMNDTMFSVPESDHGRLAALYVPGAERRATRFDAMGDAAKSPPVMLSGGGGLVSTAGDYHRFTQMLLRGGELDGVRLLGRKTVDFMTMNHLPGGVDLEGLARPTFAETSFIGIGFGLGFSVVQNPAAHKVMSSTGSYGWGGAASTTFWIDPVEEITAMFFTQLLPSSTYDIRGQLEPLVYQALID